MSVCQTPIIVALDYPTRDAALKLADQLDPKLCRVKVGKELFTSCAADIVGTLRDKGFEVFLDLKFHDIPNTTAMAVKAAAEMGVWMVNVHCSGGLRMMAACREVLEQRSGPKPLLIGVTVLTSMEREDLAAIGLDIEPQEQVLRLAALAQKPASMAWSVRRWKPGRSRPPTRRCNWSPRGFARRAAPRMTSAVSSRRVRPWTPARTTW